MKISTKGRYALRVMLDIAGQDTDGYIPVRDISERQHITVKYMEQIISQLAKAGYLKSVRGIGGGYKLTRAPKDYTVGEILRAIEGSLAPVACIDDAQNQCDRRHDCLTLPFWEGLNQVIQAYVDGCSLADLLEKQALPPQ